jgi:UDP-N-acetylmuramoyl-L-alanyl-D-glutamate--2,6-diaminopimelate ligase
VKILDILLYKLPIISTWGDMDILIDKIAFDSRQVDPTFTLFVAVRGTQVDGHDYIQKAIEKGAVAIICEQLPPENQRVNHVTFVEVANSAKILAQVAAAFYEHPTNAMSLIGITGTNGKTTTATLLYDLFTSMGYKCGLISTVEYRIAGQILPSTHTTPDPMALNSLFQKMVQMGVEYAFMEVSSHAIHQDRIAGLTFRGGVFTNITHDHLDYHKTFDEYIKAKKKFFDNLPPKTSFALTNGDDRNGNVMVQNSKAQIYRYSLKKMTTFKAKIIENALTGLHLNLDGHDYYGRLIGEFNAYNTLACYATAVLLGIDKTEILTKLSALTAAEGRFDYTFDPNVGILGIVDYAHTPDALEKVLQTIHQLRKKGQRIITVAGCGGDRDPKKRSIMGRIGAMMSDIFIITSDNPRMEDSMKILQQMELGVPTDLKDKTLSVENRKTAIEMACEQAEKGDIILVAGKGHEKYQDINGVKHPFDDKQILAVAFRNKSFVKFVAE